MRIKKYKINANNFSNGLLLGNEKTNQLQLFAMGWGCMLYKTNGCVDAPFDKNTYQEIWIEYKEGQGETARFKTMWSQC